MTKEINASVNSALEDLRRAFPNQTFDVVSDDSGGAFVTASSFSLGSQYQQDETWVGFHITFQCPHADVYPHFCDPCLSRVDGKRLGAGFSNTRWNCKPDRRPATQISRRSRRFNPAVDTPALKLAKVIQWINEQ